MAKRTRKNSGGKGRFKLLSKHLFKNSAKIGVIDESTDQPTVPFVKSKPLSEKKITSMFERFSMMPTGSRRTTSKMQNPFYHSSRIHNKSKSPSTEQKTSRVTRKSRSLSRKPINVEDINLTGVGP